MEWQFSVSDTLIHNILVYICTLIGRLPEASLGNEGEGQ